MHVDVCSWSDVGLDEEREREREGGKEEGLLACLQRLNLQCD